MLALALILDALFGEPDWLWRRIPHPAILMGRGVAFLDNRLNSGAHRKLRGIATVFVLVVLGLVVAVALSLDIFHGVFELLGTAALLAQRSLSDHVIAVARGLRVSLDEGRRKVSLIVGRDPETLDEGGVSRAAIESAAENWSDGVVAPAFWFLVAGLPGIVVYKLVNTADSMIGHRNERYSEFGWAAARLDDAMNFIPARFAGAIICIVGEERSSFAVMRRDAGKHKSVNAGWPEAAVAASLDVALAGPRVYDGVTTDDPYLNAEGRVPDTTDIENAVAMIWKAWAALVLIALLISVLRAF